MAEDAVYIPPSITETVQITNKDVGVEAARTGYQDLLHQVSVGGELSQNQKDAILDKETAQLEAVRTQLGEANKRLFLQDEIAIQTKKPFESSNIQQEIRFLEFAELQTEVQKKLLSLTPEAIAALTPKEITS